jgi:chromosome segregation and condensation protein ScpB
MARVRTAEQATTWVNRVGLALLFPKASITLPSLWEQVNGSPERTAAVRDEQGRFLEWTEEMGTLWRLKDELPALDLVCVGRHLARMVALVAPPVLPALVAARPEPELETAEAEVLAAVEGAGEPLTGPELRALLGRDKKTVDRAIAVLHRHLLLTNGRLEVSDGSGTWGALAHDLLARKWRLPASAPPREQARCELGRLVLASAGELTAADLGAALGWRRREAAAVLDEIAESREENGFRVWMRP